MKQQALLELVNVRRSCHTRCRAGATVDVENSETTDVPTEPVAGKSSQQPVDNSSATPNRSVRARESSSPISFGSLTYADSTALRRVTGGVRSSVCVPSVFFFFLFQFFPSFDTRFFAEVRVKWLLAAPARLSYWLASLVWVSCSTTSNTSSPTHPLSRLLAPSRARARRHTRSAETYVRVHTPSASATNFTRSR